MGTSLSQTSSVRHKAVNADYNKFYYNRIFSNIEKDVNINGEVVTLTKGIILPIAIKNHGVKATAGEDLDGVYLLGHKKPEASNIKINPLVDASQRGTLFLWTQGGQEKLVSDGAVGLNASNTEYLDGGDDPDLEPDTEKFHIGGWLYLEVDDYGALMSKWNESNDEAEYLLWYHSPSKRLRFSIYSTGNSEAVASSDNFGNIPLNTWLFVDAKWDNSNIFIRVNNGVYDTTTFSGDIKKSNETFKLGRFINENGFDIDIDGRLDSTFFYKGGTLTDSEITFLYNSGDGRTYAEVASHSTLGSKFDGTSGYWWNLDEVSGTRFDATGGGKDLTPVNSPSLAQGVVAGQPSTEQAALTKWLDDSGNNRDPEQSTSTNKPFTFDDSGTLYVEGGGSDDYVVAGGTVSEWESFFQNDFFICVVAKVDSDGSRFIAVRDTNATGGISSFEFRLISSGRLDVVYTANGNSELLRSSGTFLDGNFHVFSCVVRTNNNLEIWEGNSKITSYDAQISDSPDHSNYDISIVPYLLARNLDGSASNFFDGRMKEMAIGTDLSRFDAIRKELVRKHNL